MADPLSITASIIAVLQLTQEVIKFCEDIREADSNATRLRNELSSTNEILYQLLSSAAMNAQSHPVLRQDSGQIHAKSAKRAPKNLGGQLSIPSRTLNMITQKGGPLDQYSECASVLKKKLAPQTGIQKARTAINWPFQKDEINTLIARIERFKTLFMLTQQEDHVYVNPIPHIVAYTLFQYTTRELAIKEFLG